MQGQVVNIAEKHAFAQGLKSKLSEQNPKLAKIIYSEVSSDDNLALHR